MRYRVLWLDRDGGEHEMTLTSTFSGAKDYALRRLLQDYGPAGGYYWTSGRDLAYTYTNGTDIIAVVETERN